MGRVQSQSTKEKISNSLKGRLVGNAALTKGKKLVPLEKRSCKNPNCAIEFECERWKAKKFCSSKCASYNNGGLRPNCGKKGEWYFNKHQDKNVYLDSTWEISFAQWLDKNEIHWTRPSYFTWIDEDNKKHRYWPDFYLTEEDKYYDIKNDYLIKLHEVKIKHVIEQNSINLEILSKEKLDKIMRP